MSLITQKFRELKQHGQKALIPFITAGDPSLAKTKAYVKALVAGGADIIELGMPFSDPMADGPVIQAADERALRNGTDLQGILNLVSDIRKDVPVPLVLMGYYNPIYHYGVERFARAASRAGVDGCLIADLPVEESQEVLGPLKKNGIDLVYLLSPTSDTGRIKKIAKKAQGYLYYVSMTGITGARLAGLRRVKEKVREIKRISSMPLAVGFGIKTPQEARAMSHFADAVVVGSAFVKRIGEGAGAKEIEAMARRFKKAIT
jgi:tryptophan synthase alpha chain